MKNFVTACLIGLLSVACSQENRADAEKKTLGKASVDSVAITPVYAKGFEINYKKEYIEVDIHDPLHEESNSFKYALVKRGHSPGDIPAGHIIIEIPVRSVVCMTSLQLSNFIKLEMQSKVVGITSTRHLFNPTIKKQLKEGKTAKIGIDGNFDNEIIMAMNPDIIFISPFKRGGYENLKDVGIPLVPHLGYKEITPLGQAEWIKFVGLLLGIEKEANEKFQTIEKRYNELVALTVNNQDLKRPVIFSGELRGGNWYAVGGKSFLAELFKDAGADYFLREDTRSGGITLDFETVYNKGDEADYWRIVNSYPGEFSYDALKTVDSRYADFRAFKEKGIIYCNINKHPFYESMPTQPEIILADLLHIFHPELLPDHEPVYYRLLK